MALKKIVILDGARPEDKHLDPVLTLLTKMLEEKNTAEVKVFRLRYITINHCIGCFKCWLKTPGECIYTNDAGSEILQAVLDSDILVLFTPVIFGGYSSELKKILDRFLPLALPFIKKMYGETHHPRRYLTFPRFIGIGVHPHPQENLSVCFKMLVGRNAVNAGVEYAAEVVSNLISPEFLRSLFQNLFSRTDKLPRPNDLNTLLSNTSPPAGILPTKNRRALLLVGSPKINAQSTSAILGGHLLHKLKKYGWTTELITLQENFLHKKERLNFLASIDRADTIVVASPLYIDSLPYLTTKALELISHHRESAKNRQPKNFLAIINNGLTESYQNAVALAICNNFSMTCGMTWAGGLAMGAGEQLISGHPLLGFKGFRGTKRPPLFYVARALDIAAAALAEERPVPEKAAQLINKKPVPFISFDFWHWFLVRKGNSLLKNEAVKNGLDIKAMRHQPYT
ncbi:MAG: hypothetical protein D3925_00840 [Candidatus Electrothrix sp. AR5]|nr:hypothetical protein [Candidatus Electrothrix sp. AR5]